MPAVVLMRHAKSDWEAGAPDRERPLSKRGRAAAAAMGRFLASAGQIPSAALTSPAVRATETLTLVAEAAGWSCPVDIWPALYEDGPRTLVSGLRLVPPSAEVLLVVGHEPTTSEAASLLVGGGHFRVPSGAALRIDFDDAGWDDVEPGAGALAWFVVPRLLG